ncbi:MAG: hypothetical protein NC452_11950 [Eubacterium sp.]|nr:hypothetical protein [Eubacterium sp.]
MILRKFISSRQAFSAPRAVIIALAGIMFFTAASRYIRLMIIASGVRDAVQSAVIATATENYGNLYNGIREGYAGGYSLTGESWSERFSGGSVYSRLGRLLGITSNGSKYTKFNSDGEEFSVYGLSTTVENAPFAPASVEHTLRCIPKTTE